MKRFFLRMPITVQVFYFLALFTLGAAAILYFWAVENAIDSELAHSRTVADMADAYRTQAAKHGGFYIRTETGDSASVGRFLAAFNASVPQPDGTVRDYTFHQKNPFLALGDFSKQVHDSPARAKFKMVSDNYMNPANAPDLFEMIGMDTMRSKNQTEYWGVVKDELRYARALVADKSCLKCHGNPAAAPDPVREQYRAPKGSLVGGGYGYTEGSIVGITSVSVPHSTPWLLIANQTFGFWVSVMFLVVLMLVAYLSIHYGLIVPLRLQARYASQIAAGDDLRRIKAPVFDSDEATSKNAVHQLSHALKAVHESMSAAMDYVIGKRK